MTTTIDPRTPLHVNSQLAPSGPQPGVPTPELLRGSQARGLPMLESFLV